MKKMIFAAALLSTIAAVPASAEPFNGAYIGLQAGISNAGVKDTIGSTQFDFNDTGFNGGIFAGFDFKASDKFVLGVEADINFGGADASSGPSQNARLSIDAKYDYSITARAGFLATPKLLIYGRAGFAADRIEVTERLFSASVSETGFSEGFLVGGGLEFAVTDNVSLRTEYRYRDLKNSFRSYQILAGAAFRF